MINRIVGAGLVAAITLATLACSDSAGAGPKTEACSASSPCSHNDTRTADQGWSEQHVKLRDGRTITCITFTDTSKAGISCDWNSK